LSEIKLEDGVLPALSIAHQKLLFMDGMLVYSRRHPGDPVNNDVRARSKLLWQCFRRHPGMIPFFLLGKLFLDPADILAASAKQHAALAKTSTRLEAKEVLYKFFGLAAQKIAKHRWPEAWEKSVGHGNFHWMNFHSHLKLNGVLTTKMPSDGSEGLAFKIVVPCIISVLWIPRCRRTSNLKSLLVRDVCVKTLVCQQLDLSTPGHSMT